MIVYLLTSLSFTIDFIIKLLPDTPKSFCSERKKTESGHTWKAVLRALSFCSKRKI
jgi:hypothetical protein